LFQGVNLVESKPNKIQFTSSTYDYFESEMFQLQLSNIPSCPCQYKAYTQKITETLRNLTFKVKHHINPKTSTLSLTNELDAQQKQTIVAALKAADIQVGAPPRLLLWGGIGIVVGLSLMLLPLWIAVLPLAASISIAVTSTLLTVWLGRKTYQKAYQQIKAFNFKMDTLFALSTITAIAVSIVAFWVPWLPCLFEVGPLILGFQQLGDAIKQRLNSEGESIPLTSILPETMIVEGSAEPVLIASLKPGDIIILEPGMTLPVDGVCLVDSSCTMSTWAHDGKGNTYIKANALVQSGSKLFGNESIRIRVKNTLSDSFFTHYDAYAQSALNTKLNESSSRGVVHYFVLFILGFSIILGVTLSFFFPLAMAIPCALAILVAACPCVLGTVPAVSHHIGIQKAAELGALVRSPDILEQLTEIYPVCCDINGTLNSEKKTVLQCTPCNDTPLERVHELLFQLESALKEESPFAAAILNYLPPVNTTVDAERAERLQNGIQRRIGADVYTLGNKSAMGEVDLSQAPEAITDPNQRLIYLSQNKTLLAYLLIETPLREKREVTQASIAALNKMLRMNQEKRDLTLKTNDTELMQRLKKTIGETAFYIVTGDNKETAEAFAAQFGIPPEYVFSEQTADSKKAIMEGFQQLGCHPAMIGDQLNDIGAFKASGLGIAIAHEASDLKKMAVAQVVMNKPSLTTIVALFEVAQQTRQSIQQNLILNITYNLVSVLCIVGFFLAYGFILNPGLSAALMVIQSGIVLMNMYRFKRQSLPIRDAVLQTSCLDSHVSVAQQLGGVSNTSQCSVDKVAEAKDVRHYSLLTSLKNFICPIPNASSLRHS